uniref:LolA-like domain-containing protein n=1 Tax=Octopus bimaculoides TaxID=37653 RepID=A0A0L8FG05_OCTBM
MNPSTYLLFLLLTFVTNIQAIFDPQVCKSNTTNIDDSFPKLDPQYSVFIEANYISNKSTVHFTEYHDTSKGANVIKRSQQDSKTDVYLFQSTGEMFTVSQDGACRITDLWKKPNKYLFGEEISNGRFFSLAGAIELAETNFFKVKEKTTVIDRGVSTSVWSACQYLPSMKATVTTTWYFATEDSVPVTPVRLHMKGKDSDGEALEYQFEFFHYKPYILTEKPIFEEEYDTINQLVRFTYKPVLGSEDSFGTGKLTKIHDYNIDVAYIIDDIRGNCTMQAIFGNDDDIRGDHNQHMATAKEIFKVDKGIFTYEGVQSIRGYDCDVWVAHIDTYPTFPLMTGSIIEWYFITRQWYYGKTAHGVPKLMIQTDLTSHEVEEKNIYNFRETEPDILLFDVTTCFEFRDKYKFIFTIPGRMLFY